MKQILFLLGLMCSLSDMQAQTLTIDACRDLALQHNKSKQQMQLITLQAQHTLRSTQALFYPDLSFAGLALYSAGEGESKIEGGRLPLFSVNPSTGAASPTAGFAFFPDVNLGLKIGGVYSAGLMLKQPLYMGGKIRTGVAMARTGVEMARQNERKTDADVILEVNEAYANCVKANELKQVAEKYHLLLQELQKNVESAIKHGLKLRNDAMKVQVKLNEVELQMRRADNAKRLATMNLCHLIGYPLNAALTLSTDYPVVADVQRLSAIDVSARPEFALLDYKAQMAAHEVKMTRSEMLPQVALLAKYGYTYGIEFNDRALLDGLNFAGGVTVRVPLYHFGERTHKVKAARLRHEQAQLEMQDKVELMQLELSRAANNLDEARLELNLSDSSLAQAEENMRLSAQRYKAGEEPLSDYLEAQALWQQAYQTQVDAHYRLYLNSVAYLKAAGQLVQ